MKFVEVLIADDHDGFRRAIRSVIESEPAYRVCGEAQDGIDAVDKTRQLRPDIVLMDVNMPRMDGLQATAIIQRDFPDCNVIVVTQNETIIAREQARIAHADGFVAKSDLSRAASDVTARREAEEKYRKLVQTLDAEVRARTRELEEQSNQVRELSFDQPDCFLKLRRSRLSGKHWKYGGDWHS